jgi:hypothetical protein
MKPRFALVSALCLLPAGVFYFIFSSGKPPAEPAGREPIAAAGPALAGNPPANRGGAKSPAAAVTTGLQTGPEENVSRDTVVPAGASAALSRRLPEYTNLPPQVVMEHLRTTVHSYQSMFGGNPVGTNPEITAALNGANPRQAQFIREDYGMRINGRGELVDPWGVAYFFHQLSATEMEIRSAGPDQVMWTADDLVIK